MPEQHSRVPQVNTEQLAPQDVQVVDESFLEYNDFKSVHVSPWVKRYYRLQRLKDLDAPEGIISREEEMLSDEDRIISEAQEIFIKDAPRKAFNRLIANYARNTGNLDEIVEKLNPPVFDSPENRLLVATLGRESKELNIEDRYDFSKIFMDENTSLEDRLMLVNLHGEALAEAVTKLSEGLPELKQRLEERIKSKVEAGVLPRSALGDEEGELYRVKHVTVFASDPVVNKQYDIGGHYEAENNVIQIDASAILEDDRLAEKIFTHEAMHLRSGLTLRLTRIRDEDLVADDQFIPEDMHEVDYEDDWFKDENGGASLYYENNVSKDYKDAYTDYKDAGLIFLHSARVGLYSRINVLNEAYTEWVTQQLLGNEYDQTKLWQMYRDGEKIKNKGFAGSYLPNRILLAGLAHYGIDMMLLGEAYFESYKPKMRNPQREPGHTVPARRTLDAAIASHTPFKSLAQMERKLSVEARKRNPKANYGDHVLLMADILAETMEFKAD